MKNIPGLLLTFILTVVAAQSTESIGVLLLRGPKLVILYRLTEIFSSWKSESLDTNAIHEITSFICNFRNPIKN